MFYNILFFSVFSLLCKKVYVTLLRFQRKATRKFNTKTCGGGQPHTHMPNMYLISSSALGIVINAETRNNGAAFTIKSKATGKDFTYLISRSEFQGKWYTHVKVEEGYLNFRRLGTYFRGAITNKREVVHTPAADAIAFVLGKVEAGQAEWLDTVMETMHTGCCLRCGRELTDAKSIENGLGPTCRGRLLATLEITELEITE